MFINLLRNNNFYEKPNQTIDTPFWSINLWPRYPIRKGWGIWL